MRNIPQANTPAVNRPIRSGVFNGEKVGDVWVIKQTGGTPYSQNGLLVRSSLKEPIYGYAKNYKKFKKEYSLFLWTPEKDVEKVEKFLDGIKVSREDVMEVLNKVRSYKYLEASLL